MEYRFKLHCCSALIVVLCVVQAAATCNLPIARCAPTHRWDYVNCGCKFVDGSAILIDTRNTGFKLSPLRREVVWGSIYAATGRSNAGAGPKQEAATDGWRCRVELITTAWLTVERTFSVAPPTKCTRFSLTPRAKTTPRVVTRMATRPCSNSNSPTLAATKTMTTRIPSTSLATRTNSGRIYAFGLTRTGTASRNRANCTS